MRTDAVRGRSRRTHPTRLCAPFPLEQTVTPQTGRHGKCGRASVARNRLVQFAQRRRSDASRVQTQVQARGRRHVQARLEHSPSERGESMRCACFLLVSFVGSVLWGIYTAGAHGVPSRVETHPPQQEQIRNSLDGFVYCQGSLSQCLGVHQGVCVRVVSVFQNVEWQRRLSRPVPTKSMPRIELPRKCCSSLARPAPCRVCRNPKRPRCSHAYPLQSSGRVLWRPHCPFCQTPVQLLTLCDKCRRTPQLQTRSQNAPLQPRRRKQKRMTHQEHRSGKTRTAHLQPMKRTRKCMATPEHGSPTSRTALIPPKKWKRKQQRMATQEHRTAIKSAWKRKRNEHLRGW